jgi:hypothetical protein
MPLRIATRKARHTLSHDTTLEYVTSASGSMSRPLIATNYAVLVRPGLTSKATRQGMHLDPTGYVDLSSFISIAGWK